MGKTWEYIFFIRIPLLVLLLVVMVGLRPIPEDFSYLVWLSGGSVVVVSVLLFLLVWVATLNAITIWKLAPRRLGVAPAPLPGFLTRQGNLRVLPFSALLLPLLFRLSQHATEPRFLWWCKVVAGAVVALGALYAHLGASRLLGRRFSKAQAAGLDSSRLSLRAPLIVGAALCAATYLLLYLLLSPTNPYFRLPPLAHVLILLVSGSAYLSALSLFLDRYRIPLVSSLVAVPIIVGLISTDPGSTFKLFDAPESREESADSHLTAPEVISRRIDARQTHVPGHLPTLVVVAASGGGVWASAWTARVLTGLQQELGEGFGDAIVGVSAVSGGSLGSLFYLESYFRERGPPSALEGILGAASSPSLWAVGWGMVFTDLPSVFVPLPQSFRARDRGWALEEAWRRALRAEQRIETRLSDWGQAAADGWFPAVAFNTTVVQRGERFALGNVAVSSGRDASRDVLDLPNRHDLDVVTAVRLSATFPYVSPISHPFLASGEPGDRHLPWQFADGGYVDNSGVLTATDWLSEMMGSRFRVLLLEIQAFPGPEARSRTPSTTSQLAGPVATLAALRVPAQSAKKQLAIESFLNGGPNDPRFVYHVVSAPPLDAKTEIPLSWDLAPRDLGLLRAAWRDFLLGPEMERIKSIMGGRWYGTISCFAGRQHEKPEAIIVSFVDDRLGDIDYRYAEPRFGTRSTHYAVGRDGTVHQYVLEQDTAFNIGRGPEIGWMMRKEPTVWPALYTIGIEVEGPLGEPWSERTGLETAELIAGVATRWGIPLDGEHVLAACPRQVESCMPPGFDMAGLLEMSRDAARAVHPTSLPRGDMGKLSLCQEMPEGA